MTFLQAIDYAALAPVLTAAGAALLVLVADLVLPLPRRPAVLGVAILGAAGTLAASLALVGQRRTTFCWTPARRPGEVVAARSCSYVLDGYTLFFLVLLSAAALGALLVAAVLAHDSSVPPGEYGFLLLASLTGALALAGARDLITLLVALETLTLPTYALVGLRRGAGAGAEAALKYLLVSIAATAVTLLGVAFVYGLTGTVHLDRIADVLRAEPGVRAQPLGAAAVVLVLGGFAFKLAAVPFHWWAPDVYQGAPVPVAAYLATVSKAGGLAGLVLVTTVAFGPYWQVWGWLLAIVAAASMTVGNLVALRQTQAVRLLAWSSVAHAGYLLAPLGAVAAGGPDQIADAVPATLAYLGFYVAINLGAFGCVAAAGRYVPGNLIAGYRGLAGRSPALAAALAFFLLGLAGLPPTLAGLVAKVVVVRSTLLGGSGWLAVFVAVNTVIGLAYYLRFAALPFQKRLDLAVGAPVRPAGSVLDESVAVGGRSASRTLAGGLVLAALVVVVVGVLPQVVLGAAVLPGR